MAQTSAAKGQTLTVLVEPELFASAIEAMAAAEKTRQPKKAGFIGLPDAGGKSSRLRLAICVHTIEDITVIAIINELPIDPMIIGTGFPSSISRRNPSETISRRFWMP